MASKYSPRAWVNLTLLLLNAIAAVGYLVLASQWWWAIPEEHGEIPITGQPFVWAVTTVEILLPFAIVDLVWAAFYRREKASERRSPSAAGTLDLAGRNRD